VELSWIMRIRIIAAMAVGAALIGIIGWPIADPADASMPVTATQIPLTATMALILLTFTSGIIAYAIAWPYGLQIGVLAPATGLAVWAVRSASMARLLQTLPAAQQRTAVYAAFKWEPLFWLAILATGLLGVLLANYLKPGKTNEQLEPEMPKSKQQDSTYLTIIIAFIGSALICLFGITVLARDVILPDTRLNYVMGQPDIAQIAFAVLVAFGTAAFAVKVLLNADYIWPISASILVGAFSINIYAGAQNIQHLAETWPAAFFSHPATAILPVQLVSFAALGSIAGYWLGVKYNYWKILEQ